MIADHEPLWPTPPDFHLAGLHLREFLPGDEQAWFDYLHLPEVARSTGWNIASPEELLPLTARTPGEPVVRFVLADGANRLVGTIGFFDWRDGQAEIAYDLAPPWWGKGIASEACAALCRWAGEQGGLQLIKANVLTDNRASARVLEKCGFEWQGTVRQGRHPDGIVRDYRVYRWSNRRSAGQPGGPDCD